MAWLKIDDRVRTHPKVVQAGPAAAWLWFCGICYCREHLTDGFIADAMLATLAPGVTAWKKSAAALVAARLWHRAEGGYTVHDFLDWNPTRELVDTRRADDRARKGKGIPSDSRRTPAGTPLDSGRTRDAGAQARSGSGSSVALSEGGAGETAHAPSGSPVMISAPIGSEPRLGPRRHHAIAIPPRDPSAFWEGPIFNLPAKWAAKAVRASNGAMKDADLAQFGRDLTARLERSHEEAPPDGFLGWLDAELGAWRATHRTRRLAVASVTAADAIVAEQDRVDASLPDLTPEARRALLRANGVASHG